MLFFHIQKQEDIVKKVFFVFIGIAFMLSSSRILDGNDFTRAELEAEILNRLILESNMYQGKPAYHMDIKKEIKDGEEISGLGNQFLKNNSLHVDYYVKDIMAAYLTNRDRSVQEPELVKLGYKTYLKKNKKQLDPVIDFFGLFVKSKGHNVNDLVLPKKKTYTLIQLKSFAVKNIYPDSMFKGGKTGVKICIAGDGFKDCPEPNKELEAFSFSTIMNSMKEENSEFDLSGKLSNCSKVVKQLKLSIDNETAIKRAQGVFWALLFQDKDLDKLLLSSYNEKKEYLPFKITTDKK